MDIVRWGLLSTAKINRRLIPAIRVAERGELVAIASRDSERAWAYAEEWEIPQAFGSYEAMLESGSIDAVYISLPNHLHAEWTIRALQAGVHVLCEKPLALTVEEVDEMTAAARENDRVLAEAFMYRYHPQTKMLGKLIQSGKVGRITAVSGIFTFYLDEPDNVRMIPEYGGGSLWDIGVYPVSLAQFVMGGPPEWVSGHQVAGETGVDETFAGTLGYSDERIAQISSSFKSPFHIHAEVLGTKGRLDLNRPFSAMDENRHLRFFSEEGVPEEISVSEKELYLGEVEDIQAAILDGAKPSLSLAESRDHIRTVQALYNSAQAGKIIYL